MPKSDLLTQTKKLFQLTTMVLTDSAQNLRHTPTYLFTETSDNASSVLDVGSGLLLGDFASCILLLNDRNGQNKGYPGASKWKKTLKGMGVEAQDIVFVRCDEPLNTLSESAALVQYANARNLHRVIIVAPAFHLVRAFMSVVTAVHCLSAQGLRVHCQVGTSLPWDEEAKHSQGALKCLRSELIITEFNRILRYQSWPLGKGGLVSTDHVFNYLKWRDDE